MPYRPSFMFKPDTPETPILPEPTGLQAPSLPEGAKKLNPELVPITKGEKLTTGTFNRYFTRFIPDNSVFEIGIKSYLTARANPVDYSAYELFEIPWNATNPNTDTLINGYIREGSNTENYRKVVEAERIFKGLYDILAKDRTLKTTNLYTEGTQFKTRDGKAYLGYYHLTLADGPCVGPEPIKGSVLKLYPISKVFSKFDK
jgi:hypothetical protein